MIKSLGKSFLIVAAESWLLEKDYINDDVLAHCLDNAEDARDMLDQAERVIEELLAEIRNNRK